MLPEICSLNHGSVLTGMDWHDLDRMIKDERKVGLALAEVGGLDSGHQTEVWTWGQNSIYSLFG